MLYFGQINEQIFVIFPFTPTKLTFCGVPIPMIKVVLDLFVGFLIVKIKIWKVVLFLFLWRKLL